MSEGIRAEPGEAAAYWDMGLLADLPTLEDHQKQSQQVAAMTKHTWGKLGVVVGAFSASAACSDLVVYLKGKSQRSVSRLTSQLNCQVLKYTQSLPACWPKHGILSLQLKDSELKSTELQERVTELESLLEETQAACREKGGSTGKPGTERSPASPPPVYR